MKEGGRETQQRDSEEEHFFQKKKKNEKSFGELKKKEQKISLFSPPGRSVKPNQCLFWHCCSSPRLRLTMEPSLGRFTSRFQSASSRTGLKAAQILHVLIKRPRVVRIGLAEKSITPPFSPPTKNTTPPEKKNKKKKQHFGVFKWAHVDFDGCYQVCVAQKPKSL